MIIGSSDNSLHQATAALTSLCAKHVENRSDVARLVVARMVNRNALLQTPSGAVRLLGGVSTMCSSSSTMQAAIAKAGGVPPLRNLAARRAARGGARRKDVASLVVVAALGRRRRGGRNERIEIGSACALSRLLS